MVRVTRVVNRPIDVSQRYSPAEHTRRRTSGATTLRSRAITLRKRGVYARDMKYDERPFNDGTHVRYTHIIMPTTTLLRTRDAKNIIIIYINI